MLNALHQNPLIMLVGRICLALIYFLGGLSLLKGSVPVDFAAIKGIPEILVWLAFTVKLLGGLMIIIGYKTRLAALALSIFTVFTAFIFHDIMGAVFLKEIAMIGGLLLLVAVGAGKFSLDSKLNKNLNTM